MTRPAPGRPPRNGKASTATIHIRCTPEEKANAKSAAKALKRSLSVHILTLLTR